MSSGFNTYLALDVASASDSRDAWMWVATHPEADESLLINIARKKNAPKIKAKVAAHKNANAKVIKAIGHSNSADILLAILENKNLPDDIKKSWLKNRRAIYNSWHRGFYMEAIIHGLPQPWKSLILSEIEEMGETGYRPPGRGRRTGWWIWKKR